MKDLEKEREVFLNNCEAAAFREEGAYSDQFHSILTCVEHVVDDWAKGIVLQRPDYEFKSHWWTCRTAAYLINADILAGKTLEAERIAEILCIIFGRHEVERELVTSDTFAKLSEKLWHDLNEALPQEIRVTLPQYLLDAMQEYDKWKSEREALISNGDATAGSVKTMRLCVEYWKFDTIIEGTAVSLKELKKMFKKARKLRKQNYDGFAELFCKLYDFKIVKVIPCQGLAMEAYDYTLDIDTDLILERVGGWDKLV